MLQHPRPGPIEAAWNVLEGVGDAEEGLDPSHLAEIGAPGGPRWPLPCHQGGQLPHLAAARFGGRRGCRSSPPLPLHRSVRSQKMECWSYQWKLRYHSNCRWCGLVWMCLQMHFESFSMAQQRRRLFYFKVFKVYGLMTRWMYSTLWSIPSGLHSIKFWWGTDIRNLFCFEVPSFRSQRMGLLHGSNTSQHSAISACSFEWHHPRHLVPEFKISQPGKSNGSWEVAEVNHKVKANSFT